MLKKIMDNHNISKILWITLSCIITILLNMKIQIDNNIVFDGNYINEIMTIIVIYYIFKKSNKYKERRLKICSNILGILLSLFYVFGMLMKYIWISNEVIISFKTTIYIIIKLMVYYSLFSRIIRILFKYIEKLNFSNIKNNDIFKPKLKNFIIVGILFFIAWIPYFLNYYPGITSFDTHYQLLQGYGKCNYSNHHPVLHTIIITSLVKIGHAIGGNYNFGIALCSITQMILCAGTFSFVIYYMGKKNFSKISKSLTFLFFAFFPFIPQLSIAIWKDIPFSLCMVFLIIGLIEVSGNDSFLQKKKYIISLSAIIALVMFFRNNGVYIILLTLPFMLYVKRKQWKKIMGIFVIPIAVYFCITGPVYTRLGISKSSPREMLSIPIQQMARIVKYKSDLLTDDEKYIINQYIPIEIAGELYNPTISDPVKNEFNDGTFNQDKINLFKLYFKLAFKHPKETMAALIGNTYGYYYPEVVTYPVATGTYQSPFEAEQFLEIYNDPIVKITLLDDIINSIYEKKIPIVSLIANIGFGFWIFLFFMFYCIYKNKNYILIAYIPLIVLYLTCLASPVSGEFRYTYAMFLCIPILTTCSIEKNEEVYKV